MRSANVTVGAGRALVVGIVSVALLFAATGDALGKDTPRLLVADGSPGGTRVGQIMSFAPTANGDVAPIAQLAGPLSSPPGAGTFSAGGVTRDAAGHVWVSWSSPVLFGLITEYAVTPGGGFSLMRTIQGSHTRLVTPRGLVFDAVGDLFVADEVAGLIEYAPGATGDVAPTNEVMYGVPGGGRPSPWGVAMDARGDLWVTDVATNTVAHLLTKGASIPQPVGRLAGSRTALAGPKGIAVDTAGNVIVANGASSTVVEFAPGAEGDTAPIAKLAGARTLLVHPAGLAVDAAGDVWVTNPETHRVSALRFSAMGTPAPGVQVSNSAPIASITGPRTTLGSPAAVLPVSRPAAITAANPGASASSVTLAGTVFPDGSPTKVHFEWGLTSRYGFNTPSQLIGSGPGPQTIGANVPVNGGGVYHYRVVATSDLATVFGPDRTFAPVSANGATSPVVYAAIAWASSATPRIVAYAPGARGDVAPQYEIAGPRTQLAHPAGLAVDGRGDVFVADTAAQAVFEFAAGARGNVAPVAQITMPGRPFWPGSVAVDGAGHLLVNRAGAPDPTIHRFTFVNGTWTLDATIRQPGVFGSVLAVAFGPDGRAIAGDDHGRILEWEIGADGATRLLAKLTGPLTLLGSPAGLASDGAGALTAGTLFNAVLRFAPGANGDAAPTSILSGSGTIATALDASGGLVVARISSRLDQFAPGASGNAAPKSTIEGPLTDLGFISAVAVSPPTIRMVTTSLPTATMQRPYTTQLAASGGFGPYTWSLTDPKTLLGTGITLSPDGVLSGAPVATGTLHIGITVTDHSSPAPVPLGVTLTLQVLAPVVPSIYVTDGLHGTLSDFPLAAAGDSAPSFVLGGTDGLVGPAGVAIDPSGRAYATSSNTATIAEFPPGAGAFAQPDRTISGAATGLLFPTAIALDSAAGVYASNPPNQSVTYYAPGANGNAGPRRTIAGSNTGINDPESMTVNAQGDLWVANTASNTLTEYAPNANGNASPIATVSAPAFLNGPVGLAQDQSGHLLVANQYGNSILRFAANANGISTPLSIIQGPDTGLDRPHGIDIDADGRIVVSNAFGHSITVYPANATDDAPPVQTIAGPSTGMGSPEALAVAPPLSVQTTRLPRGTAGTLYTAQLKAALGSTPYRWRVTRGRLPLGLRLTRSGEVTGVPRRAERRRFRVQVIDSSRRQMRASVNLTLGMRCPAGRHGLGCRRGAVRTTVAKLRLLACRRRGRCTVTGVSISLRVIVGRLRVTLVRGHTVYGRGTVVRTRRRERIELRLSRSLRPGVYILRQVGSGQRVSLPLTVPFALSVR